MLALFLLHTQNFFFVKSVALKIKSFSLGLLVSHELCNKMLTEMIHFKLLLLHLNCINSNHIFLILQRDLLHRIIYNNHLASGFVLPVVQLCIPHAKNTTCQLSNKRHLFLCAIHSYTSNSCLNWNFGLN